MSTAQVYTTIVKWYNENKGFGFLDTKDEDLGDIFLHASVWKSEGRDKPPATNVPIVVEAVKLGRKLRATKVVSVG